MPLIIKGKLLDKTSPVICVPIVDSNHDDIIDSASRIAGRRVDMVEWRADFYEDLFDKEELLRTLTALKGILSDTIFLTTVRTGAEGGEVDLAEEEMMDLLTTIAGSRCPDLMDVEYFQYANPKGIISEIQSRGIGVIASHHDFEKTTSKAVNLRLLEEMEKADPDIVKLCMMPTSPGDVFEMGAAAAEFNDKNPSVPLIVVSMGKMGVISRIAPSSFASSVTFGTIEKASAPGQIEFDKLKEILEITK